ncbi:type I restriction endonuclease subunit R [bacterium]|nr:type I restriction endonuclease subunit R [bacterium]
MNHITENILEETCLFWLEELGWNTIYGPDIAPDTPVAERSSYSEVILKERLRTSLTQINPDIPSAGIDEAVKRLMVADSPDLIVNNRNFHRYLTDGIDVEIPSKDEYGGTRHLKVWLIDIETIENNDWLALNQLTVIEKSVAGQSEVNRRADVVLYLNGLPVAVFELKNPGDENATIKHAFNQLQTYKNDIPTLFNTNELLVISDGILAKSGTLTSGWDRYMPWRTVAGEEVAPKGTPELETLVRGLFERCYFLDYILNFIVFEDDGSKLIKKAAAYHQFWAVNKALTCTLSACGIDADPTKLIGRFPKESDPWQAKGIAGRYGKGTDHFNGKRIGVVWHTQGSGKSLSMTFFSGKVVRHPDMGNPTLVIITDRNDLDDQLFGTFTNCMDLLRQSPVQAGNRSHLRDLLKVASGGIVFTTIQKFMPDEKGDVHPLLSERNNIVVIADEAHRSQYDFIDGFARHLHDALPNASFIGFTGTPIESDDRSTPAVFGDYIDKYDILRAVEDGATVPIYYESRLAKIELSESGFSGIDPEFEQITEAEEESGKQRLKTKWAALEAMVGADDRIKLVVSDLATHFEKRLDTMDGKAMVVCMSRRICVDVYNALKDIRPDWHSDDESEGFMKIVMSGSASDNIDWQPHIRNKAGREDLSRRFKDPDNSLKLVIVRDMWLTGFDCPSMHTMYIDKPMNGHNLMQAIARVNRVFRDKPGGLVVDYIGLADSLKRALANYTASGGKGYATIDQEQAAAVLMEKYEVVRDMVYGFDYRSVIEDIPAKRISGITQAMEFILGQDNGKKRYLPAVSELTKAFALAVPHEKAIQIRDEVGLFQEVRAALVKTTGDEQGRTPDEIESAIKQLVSKAVSSTEVVDIFEAAGMDKPDISILSDEFLEDVRTLPQKNLALELLKKLINDEIKTRSKKNVIQARSFAEMLEQAVKKYQNRAIEAAEIIQELIDLAKEIRKAGEKGNELGLTEDELAFYDALADNGSAKELLGDEKLVLIAQLLVERVKKSVSIDWTLRENARAQIRVMVKRILREYGYPPDLEKAATELVIEQAEVLCKEWTID